MQRCNWNNNGQVKWKGAENTDLPASRSRNCSRSERSLLRGKVPWMGRSAIPANGLPPVRKRPVLPMDGPKCRSPLLPFELQSSRCSSGCRPRLSTTTGGGFCSGRGGGGDTAPAGPLRCLVVSTRRRGIDMTMTTSSRLIRVTSTRLMARISSPTYWSVTALLWNCTDIEHWTNKQKTKVP